VALLEQRGFRLKNAQAFDLFPRCAHVETVVLLSREKADDHIRFSINTEDLKKNVGGYATYGDIKAYVLEKFGLKVSSLYIAQTKDKCGIKERENYYIGEGKSKELICPPEKEQAIMDAFRHFGMLRD
jgi:23S rRNA (uracil1939-C5)-methyltransferase